MLTGGTSVTSTENFDDNEELLEKEVYSTRIYEDRRG
jgi:hypothetical protein